MDAHSHSYSATELAKLPDTIAKQLTPLAMNFREDLRTALAENDNRLANKLGQAFASRQSAGKKGVVVRVDWFQTGARIKRVRDFETQLAALLDRLAENGDGAGVYAGDSVGEKDVWRLLLWAGMRRPRRSPRRQQVVEPGKTP